MMPDLVDQVFGGGPEEPPADEYYPGSRRKLGSVSSGTSFVSDPWRDNYTIKRIGDQEIKMYPIGAIASALGVSVYTIRYWTRKGYLPTEQYRLPKNMIIQGEKAAGRRLYLEPMIDAAVAAFDKRGLLDKPRVEWSKHPDLPIEIYEEWSRIRSAIQGDN